jgi:hypothetical protein
MKAFRPYVGSLHELLKRSTRMPAEANSKAAIEAALNGQPAAELRRCISISRLRAAGAFFTGSALAHRAIAAAGLSKLKRDAIVLDPTCGVGDLLVALVEHLPRSNDFVSTLSEWGERILGRDVQPEFVRATKLRLALAAIGGAPLLHTLQLPGIRELFPGISAGSSLTDDDSFGAASHILINPPFTQVASPADCKWGSGKVNSAALFMDACVTRSEPGTRIVAILPDVLRSGSRYDRWRSLFQKRVDLSRVEIVGRFDRHADVDVFIAVGSIRKKIRPIGKANWVPSQKDNGSTIGEKFDVSVGAVVSYRDPRCGPSHPFLQARGIPAWDEVRSISDHRRFRGRTFKPPFVVVRRTSRPGDKHRAVGTIIRGQSSVAVENHLLVLKPKNATLAMCRQLLVLLQQDGTTNMLNRRIRCRHLTVLSLRELPWRDA